MDLFNKNLIFVGGKGGVGKTSISKAIARALSEQNRSTLWTTFEDPTQTAGSLQKVSPYLWEFNCDASAAFEEYAQMKIGMAPLTKIFLQNKVVRYLSKAAPGIHELVLLGKVWHERKNYEHVVVDMPSTGYGLAMFQSTRNFANLFKGGPIHRDAEAMLETFADPKATGHLIVALPEEMPLRESIELRDFLAKLFPLNGASFLVNRVFPKIEGNPEINPAPDAWPTPIPENVTDYAQKRNLVETHNLRIWEEAGIAYEEVPFLAAEDFGSPLTIVPQITRQLTRASLV